MSISSKEKIMLTLSDIAREKLKARAMGLESKFRIEIYNEMLEAAINEKPEGYSYLDGFNGQEYKMMLDIVNNIRHNDFELKHHITDVDANDDDLSIEVTFSLIRGVPNE
jgi:hypothetical protein